MEVKIQHRNKEFLKPFDVEEIKRQREVDAIALRKKKRIENSNSKRRSEFMRATASIEFPEEILTQENIEWMPILRNNSAKPIDKIRALLEVIKLTAYHEELIKALVILKKVFSANKEIKYQEIFNEDLTQLFINLLKVHNTTVKKMVLHCIINIFNGEFSVIRTFIDKGVVAMLIYLLRNDKDPDVIGNSLWALGNIIGDHTATRDFLIHDGLLRDLLKFFSESNETIKEIAIWVLGNFCKNLTIAEKIGSELFIIFPAALNDTHEILRESLWLLYYLTSSNIKFIEMTVKANLIPYLLDNIRNTSGLVASPVLKILDNFAIYSDGYSEFLIEMGVACRLGSCFQSKKPGIQKSVFLTYSNFLGTGAKNALAISEDVSFQHFLEFIYDTNLDIKVSVAIGICNSVSYRNMNIINKILLANVLGGFLSALITSQDEKLVLRMLVALEYMFEALSDVFSDDQWEGFLRKFNEYNGMAILEDLQGSRNADICNICKHLIVKYIGTDDQVSCHQPYTAFSFS